MKNTVVLDVTPCASCKNQRFWGDRTLFVIKGTRIGKLRTTLAETRNRRTPHGVKSQKTAFFIVTAVETSNLT
jgi:hypothetical protein